MTLRLRSKRHLCIIAIRLLFLCFVTPLSWIFPERTCNYSFNFPTPIHTSEQSSCSCWASSALATFPAWRPQPYPRRKRCCPAASWSLSPKLIDRRLLSPPSLCHHLCGRWPPNRAILATIRMVPTLPSHQWTESSLPKRKYPKIAWKINIGTP